MAQPVNFSFYFKHPCRQPALTHAYIYNRADIECFDNRFRTLALKQMKRAMSNTSTNRRMTIGECDSYRTHVAFEKQILDT
jgi:hypothetical protein